MFDGARPQFDSGVPRLRRSLPGVFLLSNLAIAQPLFDVMGRHAEFFVAHHATSGTIALGSVALSIGIPLTLTGLLVGMGLVMPGLARRCELLVLGGLASLASLTTLNLVTELPAVVLLPLSAIAGIGIALLIARSSGFVSLLRVVSPAALLFPIAFLFFSPAAGLVFGESPAARVSTSTEFRGSIFVIVFDEFSTASLLDEDLAIDADLHPNFARLAATSDWYRQNTTVSHSTQLAVPAILTGRYPTVGKLPVVADHPINLFSLLGASHRIDASQVVTDLCPASVCREPSRGSVPARARAISLDLAIVYLHLVVPRDERDRLPSLAGRWTGFGNGDREPSRVAGDRKFQFLDFIESIRSTPDPQLKFIHSLLPHVIYEYLPDGTKILDGRRLPGWDRPNELWTHNPALVDQAYQRYLLQVAFVDRLLGSFLDRLESEGLFDEALLIVTADHGVNFIPGGSRRGISAETAATILPVPLFIKRPGQRLGSVVDANVQSIDILPTLVDLLDITPRPDFDGISALAPESPARNVKRAFFHGELLDFPSDLSDGLRSEVARISNLFGNRDGRRDLFDHGAVPGQIGRRVDEYPTAAASEAVVILDNGSVYVNPRARGGLAPVLFTGRLEARGPRAAPVLLIAAIDDRVVGITRTYVEAGEYRFSFLVNPDKLSAEGNRLTFFLSDAESPDASATDADLVLSAVGFEPDEPTEVAAAEGEDPGPIRFRGRLYEPSKAPLVGGLSFFDEVGDGLRIGGWVGDRDSGRPAVALLVLSDGLVAHEQTDFLPRPDVAKAVGESYRTTGFDFEVPRVLYDEFDPSRFRVVALLEGDKAVDMSLRELRKR